MRFGPVQHTLRCLTRSSPAKQTGTNVGPVCAHIAARDDAAVSVSCSGLCPTPCSVPRPSQPAAKANQIAAAWPSNASPARRSCAATIAPRYISTAADDATTQSDRDSGAAAALPSLQELEDSIGQLSTASTVIHPPQHGVLAT